MFLVQQFQSLSVCLRDSLALYGAGCKVVVWSWCGAESSVCAERRGGRRRKYDKSWGNKLHLRMSSPSATSSSDSEDGDEEGDGDEEKFSWKGSRIKFGEDGRLLYIKNY